MEGCTHFVGGPLDRQCLPNIPDNKTFTYEYKKDGQLETVMYNRVAYPWKDEHNVSIMLLDSLPKSYQHFVVRNIRHGMGDNLTLGEIILCLPKLSDSLLIE